MKEEAEITICLYSRCDGSFCECSSNLFDSFLGSSDGWSNLSVSCQLLPLTALFAVATTTTEFKQHPHHHDVTFIHRTSSSSQRDNSNCESKATVFYSTKYQHLLQSSKSHGSSAVTAHSGAIARQRRHCCLVVIFISIAFTKLDQNTQLSLPQFSSTFCRSN